MTAESVLRETVLQPVRLPKLEASQVALTNHLLSRAGRSQLWLADQLYEWRWHPADTDTFAQIPACTEICLISDRAACWLILHHEATGIIDTDINLSVVSGETLPLAAALRYSRLIEHIDSLSGRPWRVETVIPPHNKSVSRPHATGSTLRFAFAVRDSSTDELSAAGHLEIEPDCWANWSVVAENHVAKMVFTDGLPVSIDVLMTGKLALTQTEWQSVREGAVILLNRTTRQGTPCVLRLQNDVGQWQALMRGSAVEITTGLKRGALPPPNNPRSHSMDVSALDTVPDADTEPDAELSDNNETRQTPTILGRVPVLLEFQLGTLSLPLDELEETLVAGYVFELGQTLGPQTVTVRANGIKVAQGELIQVGDALAVRVKQLVPHGSV